MPDFAEQGSLNRPVTESAESAHEALTVAMAQAMLQISHIVGAEEAHDSLKRALHDFDPDHVPEAYRDAPAVEERQHGDDEPE